MPLMWRVVASWTGGQIGQGYTNLFFTEGVGTAQQAIDASRAFLRDAYGASTLGLPLGITITFQAGVDVMEPDNGMLLYTTPVTAPSPILGSGTGNYSAPSGACVTWTTSGVVAGHRVYGRTFLVPMSDGWMDTNGTLGATAVTNISAAAPALISAAPEFCIWHRPPSAAAGGGSTHPVLAFRLQDKVAVLTSRR